MQKYSFLLAGTVASLLFLGLGCNPGASISNKIGEKVAEGIINQSTGGKASVDLGKDKMVFKDNKTGSSMAYGENLTIPDDFPKDVPVYPGASVKGIVTSKEGGASYTLTLMSKDTNAKVIAWYQDKMKSDGWTEEASMSATGYETRSYQKDSLSIGLNVIGGDEQDQDRETSIMISRTEKK